MKQTKTDLRLGKVAGDRSADAQPLSPAVGSGQDDSKAVEKALLGEEEQAQRGKRRRSLRRVLSRFRARLLR